MAPIKRALAPALVAAILAAALAVGAAPAGALTNCTVSAAEQALDAEEQRMLVLVNDYRASRGLGRLTYSPDVTRAAAWFSRHMADTNTFPANHVDGFGRDIPTRLTQCDVRHVRWAENIAALPPTAQEVFDLWRNSPPHNTNLLEPNVTLTGIARAFRAGTRYGWYWTMDYTTPPSTSIAGSTWYSDGANARTGTAGATVRAYAVGAFANVPYRLVLAAPGCSATVAELNSSDRYANASGFIASTVGTVPTGLPPGPYTVCFRSTDAVTSPTAAGPVAFTLQ